MLSWSLAGLRKEWNRRKDEVAPWWAENSKEAYNTGLDALARGLDAWRKSRKGERAGKAIGFPKFKLARSCRSVRFTTGTIRVEADRHHVTLPRVDTIRTHESTRKLARRIEAGTARILSATVSEDSSGRWFCSFQVIVRRSVSVPGHAGAGVPAVGVDVGVKADSLLVVAAPDGRETGRSRPRSPWPPPRPGCVRCSAGPPASKAPGTRKPGPGGRRRNAGPGEAGASPHPRPRRRRAPRRAAQGDDVPGATAPGHHGGDAERLRDALSRRRPQARPEPRPRRRRPHRGTAHARLQMHLVRLHPRGSRTLLSIEEALFGLRQAKAKPDARDRIYKCDHCGLEIDRDLNAAVNRPDSAKPAWVNRVPPGVARWQDVEPPVRPNLREQATQEAVKR